MLEKSYEMGKSPVGNPQYMHESGTIMLISDLAMLTDPDYKVHVEKYAADKQAFFADFKKAWVKLQENGCSNLRDSL